MRNVLIVISGPSGVGKGTVAKKICETNENFYLSVSCTTRLPRTGEINGREYFFIDKSDFIKKIDDGGFLEFSEHFGNYYGTPKDNVTKELKNNDVILEIDVNGGLNVKKTFPEVILIMLLPPSIEELKNRLMKRGTETLEDITSRMERISYEVGKKDEYDYVVVNDSLEETVLKIQEIINKEKNK